jgi:hypothetical protein
VHPCTRLRAGIYWHDAEQEAVARKRIDAIPGCAVEAEAVKTFFPAGGAPAARETWGRGVLVPVVQVGAGQSVS